MYVEQRTYIDMYIRRPIMYKIWEKMFQPQNKTYDALNIQFAKTKTPYEPEFNFRLPKYFYVYKDKHVHNSEMHNLVYVCCFLCLKMRSHILKILFLVYKSGSRFLTRSGECYSSQFGVTVLSVDGDYCCLVAICSTSAVCRRRDETGRELLLPWFEFLADIFKWMLSRIQKQLEYVINIPTLVNRVVIECTTS